MREEYSPVVALERDGRVALKHLPEGNSATPPDMLVCVQSATGCVYGRSIMRKPVTLVTRQCTDALSG